MPLRHAVAMVLDAMCVVSTTFSIRASKPGSTAGSFLDHVETGSGKTGPAQNAKANAGRPITPRDIDQRCAGFICSNCAVR